MSNTIYLAGLPRSGSTLLCNLLAQHPEITSTPSSPLCEIVQNMRKTWSDSSFLLSQLDKNFDEVYDRLRRSTVSFINEWGRNKTKITIDKNRGWLFCIESLRHLFPDFKIIVTLRDIRSVYASVEKQHRKTMLLDFPDHMEHNLIDARASALFDPQGIIGSPLKAIDNIGDVPNISQHIFYVKFEHLLADPKTNMDRITNWMGLEPFDYDFENIEQITHESDSHYRFKYRHVINKKLSTPDAPLIAPRIFQEIYTRFNSYYQNFYPEVALQEQEKEKQKQKPQNQPIPPEQIHVEALEETENRISQEINEVLTSDVLDMEK